MDISGHDYLGGLVGLNNGGFLSNCSTTGTITGEDEIGGLVGRILGGSVSNCYSTGSVHGNRFIAGLVGRMLGGSVSNCYAKGRITGSQDVRGLVGFRNDGSVSNSFWDNETSGRSKSGGGKGKSTVEMKDITTFTEAGWDIVSISDLDNRDRNYTWNIINNESHPFLSWEEITLDVDEDDDIDSQTIFTGIAVVGIITILGIVLLWKKPLPQIHTGASEHENLEKDPTPGVTANNASQMETQEKVSGIISPHAAKMQKIRGSRIIFIALVLGVLQALFTIPYGGGLTIFASAGGIIGAIGMLVAAKKNAFIHDKVKKGAYFGAILFLAVLVMGVYQYGLFEEINEQMDDINQDNQDINSNNWKEKKSVLRDDVSELLDNLFIFILLLAATTGMLAVAATMPTHMSEHVRRRLMLIPILLFISTMIIVSIATYDEFQDLENILDDLDEAENDLELKEVSKDLQEYDESDFILGSQIGGLLNLINLIIVIWLVRSFKPAVEPSAEIAPPKEKIQSQSHKMDYSALNKKQLLDECKRRELKVNWWTADQKALRKMLEENDKQGQLPLSQENQETLPLTDSQSIPTTSTPPADDVPISTVPPPLSPPSSTTPDSSGQPTTIPAPPPSRPNTSPPGIWSCPKCGKQLEASFESCIGCGFRRDGGEG